MNTFYVTSNYEPSTNFKLITYEYKNYPVPHPTKQVTLNGKSYELMNVYQKEYNFYQRLILLFKAIKEATLGIYYEEETNKAKIDLHGFWQGRKIYVIYKEKSDNPNDPIHQEPLDKPKPPEPPKKTEEQNKPANQIKANDLGIKKPEEPLKNKISYDPLINKIKPAQIKTHEIYLEGSKRCSYHKINVLRQDLLPEHHTEHDFDESCGYHVFKNACLAMGLFDGTFTSDDLLNQKIYDSFYNFISQFVDINAKNCDIDITTLTKTWNFLLGDDEIHLPKNDKEIIEKARKVIRQNKEYVTIINYADDLPQGASDAERSAREKELFLQGKISVGAQDGLMYIANFEKLIKNLKNDKLPLYHLFLIGGNGHWTLVVYEKDNNSKELWYGFDSTNVINFIRISVPLLSELLKNPDGFVTEAYHNNLSDIA